MPRPMKFWEVVSAFRDDPKTLRMVFESEKWHAPYAELYAHFDESVQKQDRQILDTFVPLELTREIAARYHKLTFWFGGAGLQVLRKADKQLVSDTQLVELTALEVHDRFGGSIIEAIREYGSAYAHISQTE